MPNSFRSDNAAEALLLPFARGALAWPAQPVVFLRARPSPLLAHVPRERLTCVQGFRPSANALIQAGFEVAPSSSGLAGADGPRLVMILPPRQRDEARALYARAVDLAGIGGRVLASIANDEGARSGEADLKRLVGRVANVTGHHCRVFWSAELDGSHDADLFAQWSQLDAPRPILDGRFVSRPGVFAWDRIDAASALLSEHLPSTLRGRGADLGAGIGVLADAVLERSDQVAALDLYEAEARALELARINLEPHAGTVALGFHWHDVAAGLPARYDFIVSNPPFHGLGGESRPDIGRRFIEVAAQSLDPGGELWVVANRHLPYEAALGAGFAQVRTVAERNGFKVIRACRQPR